MTRSRAPRLTGVALGTALTAASLAACEPAPETAQVTEDFYCTTEDGTIVDEDLCETNANGGGGGGFYFFNYGSYGSGHPTGHKINGGTRVPYNDIYKNPEQRKSLGLPESGKLSGNTGGIGGKVVRSAPGVKAPGVGGGGKVSGG